MASKEPLIEKKKPPAEPFHISLSPPCSFLLNPVALLLWTLDFIVWCVTIVGPIKWLSGCCANTTDSVQVQGNWRIKAAEKALMTNDGPELTTVHEVMQQSYKTNANRKATGTRKFAGLHQPEGVRFPLMKFAETEWLTYKELGEKVKGFGAGLVELGLEGIPKGEDLQKLNGPHTVLIFEETSAPWAISALGAFTQSICVATSYATLGMSAVIDALNETGAAAIVCNIKDVEKVAAACDGKAPSLKNIIFSTNNSLEKSFAGNARSFKILSVDEVVDLGLKSGKPFNPPTPDTLGVIMYTSGSTGKPKGVMIKHKSMVASITAMKDKFMSLGGVLGGETYLAYLPAAHILELIAELTCFAMGSEICFADPKTISSKGACRVRPDGTLNQKGEYPFPPGAIQEFRPTIMAGVPKIWDILKKGVEDQVGKTSPMKQFIFKVAFMGRYWAVNQRRDTPLLKCLVLKGLADTLGGRLKMGLSGGGPISGEVQTFIRTAFCMPLLQGYALTETTCAGTVQSVHDNRNGIAGPPIGSIEIKLRSCMKNGEPEVMDREKKPYLAEDKHHYGESCAGRGEVMIRGPSVSEGYFKQKAKTDEVFDADGWFMTGDVAIMTLDGVVKIVDRVKNMLKLKGGEYIAIENMEKEYATSPYVDQLNGGVMCYGDGEMDKPVALIQANYAELKKWATSSDITFTNADDLCKMPATEKMVLDSLSKAGKEGKLGANEFLGAIALISGTGSPQAVQLTSPWTPENGCLTASNKLSRQTIQTELQAILDPLKKKGIR